jgi:hypothetical protein
MTRFEPTLIVTRLVVERNGRTTYDERFHEGVNVIRGQNSSGKSTILNFIFYGLGGDLNDWSEHALLCTRVIVEVRINGNAATLSREISAKIGQPMEIFGGPYEDAITAPRAEWTRYPYRRSTNMESFSQALFRLLGIPEVVSDASGNLTIHQILRLLYSDQLSPVESLFRYESQFDSPILRDAIGRLLCGSYDASLYDNEVAIRTLSRQFDTAAGQLTSLFAVLGKTDHSLTMEWLEAQRRSLNEERKKLVEQIATAEREIFTSSSADELSLDAQHKAYAEVQSLQKSIADTTQGRDALTLEMADSAAFIQSLEDKIESLKDTSAVAEHLGIAAFGVCPACYAVTDAEAKFDEPTCYLCKTPFGPRTRDRLVAIINDAAIQLKQSRILQDSRQQRLSASNQDLQALMAQWTAASTRLTQVQSLPSSSRREALRTLHQRSGYLDRQVEDLSQKAELIRLIDEVSARKDKLNTQINELKTRNERLRAEQERRLNHARTAIAEEVKSLLRNDLRREGAFENPQVVAFDFASNSIAVDGHSYFSASSRAILRSSFYLAFFTAATKDPAFRHPRFVMIDSTEDKGMEVERSQNFQNQMLRISRESKVEHQIIYATSMISSDLDDDAYHVGKFSTRDDYTIDIQDGPPKATN